MIKIQFFRKNFLQHCSVKIPIKHRKSGKLSLSNRLKRTIIRVLKKTNTSNLVIAYYVNASKPLFSVIHQLKFEVDTEENLIRGGAFLINSY